MEMILAKYGLTTHQDTTLQKMANRKSEANVPDKKSEKSADEENLCSQRIQQLEKEIADLKSMIHGIGNKTITGE